jgi:hypothetical protein
MICSDSGYETACSLAKVATGIDQPYNAMLPTKKMVHIVENFITDRWQHKWLLYGKNSKFNQLSPAKHNIRLHKLTTEIITISIQLIIICA